ncbi:MAG: hypothetical protein EA352_00405 [Gemmatimonadales bacterium]|nr:MAG: hypothetical protein EA352_00405 [Gemmatimonadales bacterium]
MIFSSTIGAALLFASGACATPQPAPAPEERGDADRLGTPKWSTSADPGSLTEKGQTLSSRD